MGEGVVRAGDHYGCKSHGRAYATPPLREVRANKRPIVVAGDIGSCVGPTDMVVSGAHRVRIGTNFIARRGDTTAHGGVLDECSPNVRVGGPSAGSALGRQAAAERACDEAARGRIDDPVQNPGGAAQSYNNCALEALRILANMISGRGTTEHELMQWAGVRGLASWTVLESGEIIWADSGATNDEDRHRILGDHYGIDATLVDAPTLDFFVQAIIDRKGIVTAHDDAVLEGETDVQDSRHYMHGLVVVGVNFGADGRLLGIVVIDPNRGGPKYGGSCLRSITPERFMLSLSKVKAANVTVGPAW